VSAETLMRVSSHATNNVDDSAMIAAIFKGSILMSISLNQSNSIEMIG